MKSISLRNHNSITYGTSEVGYSEVHATLTVNGIDHEVIIDTNNIDFEGLKYEVTQDPRFSDFNQYHFNDSTCRPAEEGDEAAQRAIDDNKAFIQQEMSDLNTIYFEEALAQAIEASTSNIDAE